MRRINVREVGEVKTTSSTTSLNSCLKLLGQGMDLSTLAISKEKFRLTARNF